LPRKKKFQKNKVRKRRIRTEKIEAKEIKTEKIITQPNKIQKKDNNAKWIYILTIIGIMITSILVPKKYFPSFNALEVAGIAFSAAAIIFGFLITGLGSPEIKLGSKLSASVAGVTTDLLICGGLGILWWIDGLEIRSWEWIPLFITGQLLICIIVLIILLGIFVIRRVPYE